MVAIEHSVRSFAYKRQLRRSVIYWLARNEIEEWMNSVRCVVYGQQYTQVASVHDTTIQTVARQCSIACVCVRACATVCDSGPCSLDQRIFCVQISLFTVVEHFFFHYYFHFVFPYFCVRLTHTTNNMHSTSMLRFTSCLNIHHIIFRVTDDAVCISTRQNATHHISFLLQFP